MLAEDKALLALDLDGEFGRLEAVAAEEVPRSAMVWAYEASLIARLRAGEQNAFEELVNEYQPLVYALTLHALGNAEDARDATQESAREAKMVALIDAEVESLVTARRVWPRVSLGVAAAAALVLWFRHERQVLWASQRVGEIDRLAKNGEFAAYRPQQVDRDDGDEVHGTHGLLPCHSWRPSSRPSDLLIPCQKAAAESLSGVRFRRWLQGGCKPEPARSPARTMHRGGSRASTT